MDRAITKAVFSRIFPVSVICALLGAVPLGVQAATIWDFSPPSTTTVSVQGTGFGNVLTVTEATRVLTATAWSERGKRARFKRAFLAQDVPGLGACNKKEGRKCPANTFDQPLDNANEREWVLFIMDGFYSFETVTLDISGAGVRNVSYWVGNVDPAIDLNKLTYTDLSGLGFQAQVDAVVGAGMNTLTISSTPLQTNALLIGASRAGSTDSLFINSLRASSLTVIPLPAGAMLFDTALLGLVVWGIGRNKPAL